MAIAIKQKTNRTKVNAKISKKLFIFRDRSFIVQKEKIHVLTKRKANF